MSLVSKVISEHTSVESWYLLRHRIDMSPSYQRRPNLWSLQKKRLLIDSILNSYDIPKIYLADFTSSTGLDNPQKKLFAVIDGKQRLEAIFQFILDEYELSSEEEAPRLTKGELKGFKFSNLSVWHPHLAERLLKYQLSVVSVVADTDDDLHRMFVRLNFGVSVNAAERRNAKPGAVPVAIRQITEHNFFTDKIRFSSKRGEDKNLAAKILMFESQSSISDTKASRLDRFTDEYVKPERWEHILLLVERVREYLDRLSLVFCDQDELLSSSGQIPVYYWLVRNNWNDKPEIMRDFIEHFDRQVKNQYRGGEVDAIEDPVRLSEYYRWTRTVNDKDSIEGRYLMLSQRWEEWQSFYQS